MDRIFEVKAHLRVAPCSPARCFLIGERQSYVMEGAAFARTLPLLDGTRTLGALIATLAGELTPPEVVYAVEELQRRGYVELRDPQAPRERVAFWQSRGLDHAEVARTLAGRPVGVRSSFERGARSLRARLSDLGVRVADDAATQVVPVTDYLDPDLDAFAAAARQAGQRWIPARLEGIEAWVGPAFGPDGPCWHCFRARLLDNRPVEGFLLRQASVPPVLCSGESGAGAGTGFVAMMIARWLLDDGVALDELMCLDLADFTRTSHAAPRLPQCPACGDPQLQHARGQRPVVLASRTVQHSDDGGYRCASPEQTWEQLRDLIGPYTGAVKAVERSGHEDLPCPVYMATFASRPALADPELFERRCGGKGRSVTQASVSALCEALERRSATYRGDEARASGRAGEIEGAIGPDALHAFSDGQRSRGSWGPAGRPVPPPAPADAVLDWTPAWSLTRKRQRHLPLEYVYLEVPGTGRCPATSNGCAAGLHLEDAVLQGLFELVERDAAAVWWYNRIARPTVELCGDDRYGELVDAFARRDWSLRLFEITHDLAIPAFAAVAFPSSRERFVLGFGCHLEPSIAAWRALTETAQLFDPARGLLDVGGSLAGWLGAATDVPPRRLELPRPRASLDLREVIEDVVERLWRAGLEVLVVDLTRPDIALPVVKVVVPGLRHFWPELGPGRLYDVPLRMGWLPSPRAESELNPVELWV